MPHPTLKRYDIKFNVSLDAVHLSAMRQLAQEAGCSVAALVRSVVMDRYRMSRGGEPTCSTGNKCLCAHAHAVATPPPKTDAELVLEGEARALRAPATTPLYS